ncbi:MAG TPA: ABC transporter substrate-binding protein [Lacisediminihabitans sp.]|uniref:ABC transporter substrate-binding protein n=1 Tax=Lacisediminihabitans sp. TaxID=2787631 RepID=UPI002ED8C3D1
MRTSILPAIAAAAAAALLLSGCAAGTSESSGKTTTLTIESWRTEDVALWKSKIIPAFEKEHPDIKLVFSPTQSENYDSTLTSKLEGGTAGDIVSCRAYDDLRRNAAKGYFSKIDGLAGLDNFSKLALSAWQDDKGTQYCVPVASVTAGVFYNADILKKLDLTVPTTTAQLMTDLKAIKSDGEYSGVAQGTSVAWDLSYLLLSNIGQNYYKGETGRQGLIDGTKKVTDPGFVNALTMIDRLQPYFPANYSSMTIDDARAQFAAGKAAFYISGSYEISSLTDLPFTLGVTAPPLPKAGDQLYVQDHPDMAYGINAKSKNKAAAKTFLSWTATPAFAKLYVNALPGFLSMQKSTIPMTNSLAKKFASIRASAKTSPRLGLDRLSAGSPTFELEIMRLMQKMLNDPSSESPAQVATELQSGLAQWYGPQKAK